MQHPYPTHTGGVGLNIQEASIAIILDIWWNGAQGNQAFDRIYRLGQKQQTRLFNMLVMETVEEKIAALRLGKLKLVNDILGEDHLDDHQLQAFDTVYRLGQKQETKIFNIMVLDTVEEKIVNVRLGRLKLANKLLGDVMLEEHQA